MPYLDYFSCLCLDERNVMVSRLDVLSILHCDEDRQYYLDNAFIENIQIEHRNKAESFQPMKAACHLA